ncbi:MAG TPA: D-alanyl-D-alanine carboxypeptidase, partial [Egibacteraceae bacterium]|nr:D-alanyl-D-alanine carboxypeptidase [Egibacteraceae bacterium]
MLRRRLVLLAVGVLLGAGLIAGALGAAGAALVDRPGQAAALGSNGTTRADPSPELTHPSTDEARADSPASPSEVDATAGTPSAAPTPTATPSPISEPEQFVLPELAQRLSDALIAEGALVDGVLGVAVIDDQGRTVLNFSADSVAMPASTQKLVTAAAALKVLGPGFRYRTEVRGTAPIEEGLIDGDLILIGSGDPTLGSPTFGTVEPDRPRTAMEALADRVVAAGVQRITGRVLGDPTVFADEPAAPGWLDRYFDQFDATKVSGLTIDGGRRLFHRDDQLLAEVAEDPAVEAAASLHVLLKERGVEIEGGGPGSLRRPRPAPERVASISSPRLDELLQRMVQHSDNHLADAIFRTIGAEAGDPTWEGSATAAMDSLEPLGLDWTGARLADGSGLSRDDRLSPRQLAHLQQRMLAAGDASLWDGLLAVSGESGTLRKRYRGTVADHRLRGK